jgi:hypothetical protein
MQAPTDDALDAALRGMAAVIAFPTAGDPGRDIAASVRARLEAEPARHPAGWERFLPATRPLRRSLLLALAALLLLAAVAAAVGLGLPGIRIIVGDPPSAPPSAAATPAGSAPLGSSLGLGAALPLDEVEALAGFELVLPPDDVLGEPDAAFISRGRVALLWEARPGLPAGSDGIGLLISQFRGTVDEGYYEKIVDSGATPEPVRVDGARGYWIAGPPHFFMYIDGNGDPVDDSHRLVGDTLIWTNGDLTFRLESTLGRDGAIELAESLE